MVGSSVRDRGCRFRYGIGVEMPHLHHCDIVYVKAYACCLELFHRAVLVCYRCWRRKSLASNRKPGLTKHICGSSTTVAWQDSSNMERLSGAV